MELTKDSVVVGMDLHKYNHVAVALDVLGKQQSTLSFSNESLTDCLNWLSGLGKQRDVVVGMEDVHGHGYHVARKLMTNGFHVRYVPAVITDRLRKHSVHKEKNDVQDAKRVGIAILHRSEEALPASASIPDNYGQIHAMDLQIQERDSLVKQQTGLKQTLHVLLHQYYGNGYRQSFSNIFSKQAVSWYLDDLNTDKSSPSVSSIVRRLRHLQLVQQQIAELDQELKILSATLPQVKQVEEHLPGCGILTAAKIIVEIKTIGRFSSHDKLARYAGIAPRAHSSAGSKRLYTDRSGNRKLNNAIHTVALSQIGNNGLKEAKEYYLRKQQEGKSKLWSLRCLKRRVVKRIFEILNESD